MKELSIEQKAKRYDEAIKLAKDSYNYPSYPGFIRADVVFPELKESEDEQHRKWILEYLYDGFRKSDEQFKDQFKCAIAWLEKQGRQKPLYIRFGDVPSNETSKIYRGEVEIGDENGVSVYPAFEVNGNIVLGLTLPITKTTLYTQQHLLEYDNRPCYLVSGDYVGKGTDGEPLIRNITIIKRLDNYRIKDFEKQGEQKQETNYPKFEFNDILALQCCMEIVKKVQEDKELYGRLLSLHDRLYDAYQLEKQGENHIVGNNEMVKPDKVEPKFKVGDWVVYNDNIYHIGNIALQHYYECLRIDGTVHTFGLDIDNKSHLWTIQDAKDGDVLHSTGFHNDCIFIFNRLDNWKFDEPNGDRAVATGYCCLSISADKMEFGIQGPDCVEVNTIKPATKIQHDLLFQKMKEAGYEWDAEKKKLKKIEQNPAAWSEEDENHVKSILSTIECCKAQFPNAHAVVEAYNADIEWLKSLRPQSHWKPSDEQIKVCKKVYADILSAKGFDIGTVNSELNRLEEELKKLREE